MKAKLRSSITMSRLPQRKTQQISRAVIKTVSIMFVIRNSEVMMEIRLHLSEFKLSDRQKVKL